MSSPRGFVLGGMGESGTEWDCRLGEGIVWVTGEVGSLSGEESGEREGLRLPEGEGERERDSRVGEAADDGVDGVVRGKRKERGLSKG